MRYQLLTKRRCFFTISTKIFRTSLFRTKPLLLLQFSRRDLLRALGFAASLLLLVWAVGAYEAWAREQEVKRWEGERARWGP